MYCMVVFLPSSTSSTSPTWEINASFMYLWCIFDISDMRNKCIQNDIKTPCFFLFAFKMSVSKPKRQHTDRTLKEKIEILGKLDSGLKAVDVCKRFNISQSTLSTWKKQRAKINEMVDAGKVLNQKHNRESFLPQVERALHLWFCEMRSKKHAPPSINHCLFKRLHCKYFTLSPTSPT